MSAFVRKYCSILYMLIFGAQMECETLCFPSCLREIFTEPVKTTTPVFKWQHLSAFELCINGVAAIITGPQALRTYH